MTRRKIIAFDELSASAKLKQHFADFGTDLCGLNGSALQGIDAAFCGLGSRSGWSDEKEMAAVDRDAVMRFLRLCQEANVPHVTVLSSAWANTSSVFPFARLQGETIEAISAMKTFSRTSIFQPSAVTGADGRLLSGGSSLLGNFMWQSLPVASQFMPKVYRPIALEDLALAMRLNVELCDASEAVEKLDYRGMMMIIGKDADL